DLINGVAPDASQFRFDISFGPPPAYRREVLQEALAILGPAMLQFGSDRFFPCSGAHVRSAIDEVAALLEGLEVDAAGRRRIMGGTAAAWLGLERSRQSSVDSRQEREENGPDNRRRTTEGGPRHSK